MAEINWTENQKRAIQARSCSIAVSAAAGSGKTAVLTNRIIERIKAGGDIKTMLVVTFTNPAAQQLKDKISDELNNALFDKQLTPKEKKHLQRQLIALPNATISTIDSFVIGLVRDNFSEAGIPVGSGVMDEAEKKQLETDVADMLIQDYYEGKITSEDRKIDDFDSFVNVFGDPLKPSVLAENIISLKNYYDTQPHPYDSILGENEDGVFEESSFGKILFNYTKSMFEYYSELFKIASEEYDMDGETKNSELFVGIKDFCDKVLDALKNKDAYSSVKELLSEYSNKTISKSGSLYHDYFKNKKSDLKSDIDSLKEKYYCYTEDDINTINEKIVIQRNNLVAFLKEFDERLSKQKALKRMYSFNDYERLCLKILTEFDLKTPSILSARLRSYYTEIYIDEYQDTNSLQDKIFSLLSRKDNLFTVGDIKQSIYRFRGAEPSIFDKQIKERVEYDPSKRIEQTKIYLSDNFRSTQQIVDAVNCVFENVLANDPVISYGEQDKLRCGTHEEGPKPEMHVFCDKDLDASGLYEKELEYIAKRIKNEMRNDKSLKYSDFAVLTRKNDISSLAVKILNGFDIPSVDKNEKEFFNNPEVMLVIALLKCIDNPYSDLYLTATMKSPLYGFSLDDQIGFRMNHKEKPLYAAVKNCSESDDKWNKKCKKLISDLDYYRPLSRIMSCSDFIKTIFEGMMLTSIVSKSEGIEREEAARANLLQLYDYARMFDNKNSKSLYDFLTYVDELVKDDAKIDMSRFNALDDAVEITTIHKSKGLQYKYVFLPCFGSSLNSSNNRNANFISSRNLPLVVMPVENDEKIDNIFYRISSLNDRLMDNDEIIRVLYVAMTRPETNLIITSAQKKSVEEVKQLYDLNSDNCLGLFEKDKVTNYSRSKFKSYFDLLIKGFSYNPSVVDLYIESFDDISFEDSNITKVSKESEEVIDEETIKKTIIDRFNFVYPYEELIKLPNKLSVSKIYPGMLDQPEDGYTPEQLKIEEKEDIKRTEIVPKFISDEEEISPREQGIAVHLFMQFFDLENVFANGIDAEMDRLLKEKFIYEETYRIIKYPWNKKKIENFFKSSLGKEMRNAKTLVRERRFNLNFPAELFSSDKERVEQIKGVPLLIQGVIDCMYINENDELILVDYKTDHFKKDVDRKTIEDTLKQRYSNQLMYYTYAARKLMNKEVAHVRLYSFAIDDIIELDRKEVL